jgi:hypothetical protein
VVFHETIWLTSGLVSEGWLSTPQTNSVAGSAGALLEVMVNDTDEPAAGLPEKPGWTEGAAGVDDSI